jgi:omega-6 fatty acid desaturase (delta-12 desaturase)
MSLSAAKEAGSIEFDQTLLAGFMRRRVALPLVIFAISVLAFALSVAAAVVLANTAAKLAWGVLAGVFIANLAIIGHDAVHRSFTRVRWLNRVIGTVAFLPALHPFSRWEHHHNRVHHRYTAQIGVDNAFSPMTLEQYRDASRRRRLYYRFMRSLWGQPFFYMVDIWWPKIFLPNPPELRELPKSDTTDLLMVYLWLAVWISGLAWLSFAASAGSESFAAALGGAALYGFLVPFLVWNLLISFLTITQHTGPATHWIMPTGRPSTYEQKVRGTVHVGFPEPIDWFLHRVWQHVAHHVNPIVPLYALKAAETEVIAESKVKVVVERWTPAYHWRLTRDCKLYDPIGDRWCDFKGQPTGQRAPAALAPSIR